jgi:GT2 family glycosyltransferase
LKLAIDSLIAKTTYPNFEVILVDNGSTDDSVRFVTETYPSIRVICNCENRGYSKANNQGIKASKADYYLLLNTDVEIYTTGWLTRLVEVLESDKTVGIVTCALPQCKELIRKNASTPYETDFAPGAVFLIRKETIDNIGLLDEIFSPCYFEDTDWCARALSAGWKIMCDPSTIVIHFGQITTKRTFRESHGYFYIYVRNRIMYEIMNHNPLQIIGALAKENKDLGSALFVGSPSERMSKLHSFGRAHKDVLVKLGQLLQRRQKRKLLSTDRSQ